MDGRGLDPFQIGTAHHRLVARQALADDEAAMTFAMLFLAAGPALNMPPSIPVAVAPATVAVTTYDAFVATEETPRLKDLRHPAIMKREGRDNVLGSPVEPASIA